MHVVMVGAGYVGLVSGACCAEFGASVICVDKDKEKISDLNKGKIPIYEPGLENLVNKNMSAGRLSFSNNRDEVSNADVVFIAVGTPSRRGDGDADLTYVFEATKNVDSIAEKRERIMKHNAKVDGYAVCGYHSRNECIMKVFDKIVFPLCTLVLIYFITWLTLMLVTENDLEDLPQWALDNFSAVHTCEVGFI